MSTSNTKKNNSRIGAKESIAQPINAQSSIVCIYACLRWSKIETKPSTGIRQCFALLVEFVCCNVNNWDCMKFCLNKYFISHTFHNNLRMCKEIITIDGATMEGVSISFFNNFPLRIVIDIDAIIFWWCSHT